MSNEAEVSNAESSVFELSVVTSPDDPGNLWLVDSGSSDANRVVRTVDFVRFAKDTTALSLLGMAHGTGIADTVAVNVVGRELMGAEPAGSATTNSEQ